MRAPSTTAKRTERNYSFLINCPSSVPLPLLSPSLSVQIGKKRRVLTPKIRVTNELYSKWIVCDAHLTSIRAFELLRIKCASLQWESSSYSSRWIHIRSRCQLAFTLNSNGLSVSHKQKHFNRPPFVVVVVVHNLDQGNEWALNELCIISMSFFLFQVLGNREH